MAKIFDFEKEVKKRAAEAERLDEKLWRTLLLAEISLSEFRIDTSSNPPVVLKE
jgi:hypothetical protein